MTQKLRIVPELARSPGAAALREARLAAGLSQEQAGERRKMSARQVRKYENNESPMEALELYLELVALAGANDNREAA